MGEKQKVALAVVHGIGRQSQSYADAFIDELRRRVEAETHEDALVAYPVYWSSVFKALEDKLLCREMKENRLRWRMPREFLMGYLADAIAYQITPTERSGYDQVHAIFAESVRVLAQEAGPSAPLLIVAHSLGTVITSNYIYDLQRDPTRAIIADVVRARMGDTPIERGETLTALYTLGSPLALWSLRYPDFGAPIRVPDARIAKFYPDLGGEWINFFDRDDVVAFPLKTLNTAYCLAVTEDRAVNAGNLLTAWNPLSHLDYWTNGCVLDTIAARIVQTWKAIN